MTTLQKGGNAALSSSLLTFSLDVATPCAVGGVLGESGGDASRANTFVDAESPSGPGLTWSGDRVGVDLSIVPASTTVRLVATLTMTGVNFGAVNAPVARLSAPSGATIEFLLTGLTTETSLIAFELYLRNGGWRVRAVAQGYAGGLTALLDDLGVRTRATSDSQSRGASATHAATVASASVDRAASLPTPPHRHPLWDRVERHDPSSHAVRPVAWDLQNTTFTTIDKIRNHVPSRDDLPPGVQKFTVTQEWAEGLRSLRGAGFESSWRDSDDRRIDPSWVSLTSAVVHQPSGRIAAAGISTHENWDLPAAFDAGTSAVFADEGHVDQLMWPIAILYIGSTKTGTMIPVDARSNLCSVDLHPASGTVAVIESLGTVGCISVYDGPNAERRRLTIIEPFSGNESVRFSFDGQWLLVPRYDGSYLCELRTGRLTRLPLKNCTWWPLADSTLLEISHTDGRCTPRLFDLEMNGFVRDFSEIRLDRPWLEDLAYAHGPEVSPDGTEVLVRSPVGVTSEHRDEFGTGSRVARVTLDNGRGSVLHDAVLHRTLPWERDVTEARWTAPHAQRAVRLHRDLDAQLSAGQVEHPYLEPGRYADEAEQIVVMTLNHAIGLMKEGRGMAYLMPEVLVRLVPLHQNDEAWHRQVDWLSGLAEVTQRLITTGEIQRDNAAAWTAFASALQAVRADDGYRLENPAIWTWT